MEAMALEVPVLVAAGGGVAELVDDEVDGLIFHDREPANIARSIERFLLDPALARRISGASRLKIERAFGDHRSAAVLVEKIMAYRSSLALSV